MVDRIRWDTVSYLPFYYVFFQFLLLTIFNLQANILTTKDILSNLVGVGTAPAVTPSTPMYKFTKLNILPLNSVVTCHTESTNYILKRFLTYNFMN